MAESQHSGPLRRVGAMWKPKPGSKSLGSGTVTIDGKRQRFIVLKNDRKTKDTDPDYVLMSSSEPEVDTYTRDRQPTNQTGSAASNTPF